MDLMMEKLKPCPFCGGIAAVCFDQHTDGGSEVFCTTCSATNGNFESDPTGIKSTDEWNTRTNPWNHNMEAAKVLGVVLLEVYVNYKRRVSTGGWDGHWTGECWVYDCKQIPAGTSPIAWMPISEASYT